MTTEFRNVLKAMDYHFINFYIFWTEIIWGKEKDASPDPFQPQSPLMFQLQTSTATLQHVEEQHRLSTARPKQLTYLKEYKTGQLGGRRGLGTGMRLPAAIAYLPYPFL